jgi:hypothetical protein
MQRVTHSTKDTDLFGTGKHGYQEGPPTATVLTAASMNLVQEEIARTVEGYGGVLSATNYGQMVALLQMARARDHILESTIVDTGTGQIVTGICAIARTVSTQTQMATVCVGKSGTSAYSLLSGLNTSWTVGAAYAGGYVGHMYGCVHNDALNLVIAYGTSGEIQTAPSDTTSLTWTQRKTGGSDIRGVACDGIYCLAVDASGKVWSSSDGVTWTDQGVLLMPGSEVRNITRGNGMWLVCEDSQVRTSTAAAGTSWTARSVTGATDIWECVWSPALSMWVAVSEGGYYQVWTSPDTIVWTERVEHDVINGSTCAAALPFGVLVYGTSGVSDKCGWYTSVDGTTWVQGQNSRLSGIPAAGEAASPLVCLYHPQVGEYCVATGYASTPGRIRLCKPWSI